ncbi:hypothetical protein [Klebsiella quasipneumoniae]|uniref:hypothetical protein n=1 Tax=Klebsiella quasipneumoniae TaxID=1463165 RepID=UPI003890480B
MMFVENDELVFAKYFACHGAGIMAKAAREQCNSELFNDNNLLLMPEFSGGRRQQVANNLRTGVHIVVPVVLYCQQDVGWSGHELC